MKVLAYREPKYLSSGEKIDAGVAAEPLRPPKPEPDSDAGWLSRIDFPHISVRELAGRDRRLRETLEQLGIDTCCDGGRMLPDAAGRAGVPLEKLLKNCRIALCRPLRSIEIDWESHPTAELIDYLVKIHHDFLRRELPRLGSAIRNAVEANRKMAFRNLEEHFTLFSRMLARHLDVEERELFAPLLEGASGGFRPLLNRLEAEHVAAVNHLRELTVLADALDRSGAGSPVTGEIVSGMRRLDERLRENLYLENNLLFPRLA